MYWEQEAPIRIDDDCSVYKPICRGGRQGCVFSPDLFNIYNEMIVRNIKHHVRVGGNNINNLRYADGTVLIADSVEKTAKHPCNSHSRKWKQRTSTECKEDWVHGHYHYITITISEQSVIPVCNIPCKGERIKQVDTFKYLGFTITPDSRCYTEIKKRTALSKETFAMMKSIFTNRNIKVYTKINTLKAYIWFILLYGCECWTLTKDLERRLEAA